MTKKWNHRRDDGGSLLAAVIVVVSGAGLCCFLALSAPDARGDRVVPYVIGAAVLAVTALVWPRLSFGQRSKLALWNAVARNHREDGLAAQYRPRKVTTDTSPSVTGTNRPITAGEARELQSTSSRTWVPSRARRHSR